MIKIVEKTNKKSVHPSSRSLPFFKVLVSFAIPLILSLLTYRYTYSGPYLPLSCQLFSLNCPKPKDTLNGFVDPEFSEIKNIFTKNLESGLDVGASVTIYYNDKIVVDLTGGIADWNTGRIYDKDTLQLVYSSTKVLSSLVVARFVEKGYLNYDEKISTYWPEFAQGDKENVTLGHLMTHSAGVGWLDHLLKVSDLSDLDSFAKILEVQPHNFGGVPTRSYHACTRGYYLNEIVRRTDPKHRTIGQIVREEIMPTYDIEFYYSVSEDIYNSRVAKIYSYPVLRALVKLLLPEWMITNPLHNVFLDMFTPGTPAHKSIVGSCPDQKEPKDWNELEVVKEEGPSYNGITNTRSMAKLAAIMANQGRPLPNNKGVEPELLNTKTLKKYLERHTTEFDLTTLENMTMTKGGIGIFRLEGIENYEFLGWGGAGGSILLWNEELKIGFAYGMNAFQTAVLGDERSLSMIRETVNTVLRLKNISQ